MFPFEHSLDSLPQYWGHSQPKSAGITVAVDEEEQVNFHEEDSRREGVFDDQLSLPLPSIRAPELFSTIVKRDGRRESFDRRKIAAAIFRAAQSIGGQDRGRADSLASAVAIYLTKQLNGRPPKVEQVNDAVERVLIEMGHASTALAYARYRDRRARIRRLREGDLELLMRELQEARRQQGAESSAGALFVRTSADTVATWDRGRIVAALERETGLDAALANLIALEVEQQIERAQIRTLTGSLIRELADARLVEHGLHEYRERHRRLGVPLYDAQRIVLGLAKSEAGESTSPVVTDRVLARAVKREFALAQVFSAPVAEAHLRGEIHLRHVSFVDRLSSIALPLECVVARGIRLPDAPGFAGPARHAETLLAHTVKFSELLHGYFTDEIVWDDVNVYFAPFLHGREREAIAQFAQMLVYEFAYRALTRGDDGPPSEISLCWGVPEVLRQREAIGPGGAPLGRPYLAFEHTAQQLAWAVVDVLGRGVHSGHSLPGPVPRIRIDERFFKTPGSEEFLLHAARVSAERRNIQYQFHRGNDGQTAVARPRRVDLHKVVLNLPRAAYRAATEETLIEELHRLVDLAAVAHEEKRRFLEQLGARESGGPLEMLARNHEFGPLVDFDTARCQIAVEGLNECVQYLMGKQIHEGDEAIGLAERILGQLRACSAQHARLNIVLAHNHDLAISRRFADLDLKDAPTNAARVVKNTDATQTLHYSAGAHLWAGHGLTPIDGVRIEGRIQDRLDTAGLTAVSLPESDPAPEAIADFVVKAYRQTRSRRIVFH